MIASHQTTGPCKRYRPAVLALAFSLLLSSASAQRTQTVFIKSVSDEVAPSKKGQTYAIVDGTLNEGMVRDGSLKDADINEVAQTLAPGLKQIGLVPAVDPIHADLVIVIHRGSFASGLTLDSSPSQPNGEYEAARATWRSPSSDGGVSNGRLTDTPQYVAAKPTPPTSALGASLPTQDARIASELATFGVNRDSLFTRYDMTDLRKLPIMDAYFTILMAYDLQAYRSQRVLNRKWVATMAITGRRNNFHEALSYFGEALNQTSDYTPSFIGVDVNPLVKALNSDPKVANALIGTAAL